MTNIINALFFRIKKTATLWVLLGISLGLILIDAAINYDSDPSGINVLAVMGQTVNVSANISIYLIIVIAILFGAEYSSGTIRNAVLSNKSRTQIYFAYALFALIITTFLVTTHMAFAYLVYGLFFGYGTAGAGDVVVSMFTTWGLALITNIFVAALTLFFTVATRKTALGLLLPLLICILGPGIVALFVMLGQSPQNMLTPEAGAWIPFVQYLFYDGNNPDGMVAMKICVITTALIGCFGTGGYFILKNSDIN